jgi:hypothetical protein
MGYQIMKLSVVILTVTEMLFDVSLEHNSYSLLPQPETVVCIYMFVVINNHFSFSENIMCLLWGIRRIVTII